MAANPRVDDLRKRLEKDPGSRLFAQLAEELRKEGDLDEAITVCRDGLQKHPAYPSARMTLGRALFDKGELTAARPEFEAVLKGAPDNILASRLLGECLDGLGDLQGAIERYKGTLVLAPGDKQILARIQEAEARLRGGGSGTAPPATVPVPPAAASEATVMMVSPIVPPPPVAPEPPPIPLAAVMEESFELERPYEQPVPVASPPRVVPVANPEAPAVSPTQPASFDPPPIPVVEADEEFELERPHEAPLQAWVPATTPAPVTATRPSGMGVEFSFDDQGEASEVEEAVVPTSVAALPSFAPEFGLPAAPPPDGPGPTASEAQDLVVEADPEVEPEVAEPVPEPEIVEDVEAVVHTAPAVAAAQDLGLPGGPAGPELVSSTLAELYFNQGFTDKALDVYRQLLEREPGNERAQARMRELRALEEHLKQEEAREPTATTPAPPSASPEMLRRQAVERTIARLEALLAAARKA